MAAKSFTLFAVFHDLPFEGDVELVSRLDRSCLRLRCKFLYTSAAHFPDSPFRLFRVDRMCDLDSWFSQYLSGGIRMSRSNVHVSASNAPGMQPMEF